MPFFRFATLVFLMLLPLRDVRADPLAIEAIFTNGMATRPDNQLVDHLRHLVQSSQPGSDIKFSVFLFYYEHPDEPLLLDLLAAAARGVNVQILIDLPESENSDNLKLGEQFRIDFGSRLKKAADKHSISWIERSPSYKNHSKIFLFSHAANQDNWVVIGSENLTDREREKHQASIVLHDAVIYQSYLKYWQQIRDGSFTGFWMDEHNPQFISYFFPQPAYGDDAIYQLLDRILLMAKGMKSPRLKLVMARWNRERFALAVKLVQLAEAGIAIEIVTRENPAIVDPLILSTLEKRPNIRLFTNDVSQINIHSKYMLFENETDNDKIVWLGSHNFTGMALRGNYETWTEIKNPELYRQFKENFDYLMKISTP